jgi:hypothetical protein
MAQLKEDEWPRDDEPTTTEREAGSRSTPAPQQRSDEHSGEPEPTVPLSNVRPDEAVD